MKGCKRWKTLKLGVSAPLEMVVGDVGWQGGSVRPVFRRGAAAAVVGSGMPKSSIGISCLCRVFRLCAGSHGYTAGVPLVMTAGVLTVVGLPRCW